MHFCKNAMKQFLVYALISTTSFVTCAILNAVYVSNTVEGNKLKKYMQNKATFREDKHGDEVIVNYCGLILQTVAQIASIPVQDVMKRVGDICATIVPENYRMN